MKNFVLIIFWLCLGCGSGQQVNINTLEPGEAAPTFNLKNVDGKMISPESYPDAKGFIVVFTCNTCPYAIAYEDRLIELNKEFAPLGYPLIAINPNSPDISSGDSYKKMQKKAKNKGFRFPYLFDEGQKVTDQYGARVTPHVFLLQNEGSDMKVVYTGAVDNDTENVNSEKTRFVVDAIAAMEAGDPIAKPTTKALGCTVKRRIIDIIP